MRQTAAFAPQDWDRLYEILSAFYDETPEADREQALARLVLTLAHELGSVATVEQAIAVARQGAGVVSDRADLVARRGRSA